jgi:hypothetical protein
LVDEVAGVKANTGADVENTDFFGHEPRHLLNVKTESFIGCLTMNILDPPEGTIWGQFNSRVVSMSHVNKLFEKFKARLDNCVDDNAMHIAVKRKWVKNISAAEKIHRVDGQTIDAVPELELTAEGMREIKKNKLWVMGGNHRRLALKKLVDELRESLEKSRSKAERLRELATAKGNKGPSETQAKNAEKAVDDLTKRISDSSKWAVTLYDLGAQTID